MKKTLRRWNRLLLLVLSISGRPFRLLIFNTIKIKKSLFSVLYICKIVYVIIIITEKSCHYGFGVFYSFMVFLQWGLLLDRSASVSWECVVSQFLAEASTLSWNTVLLSFLASPLSIIILYRSPVWCIVSVKPFLSSPLHNVSFQCKALSSVGDSV